MTPNIHPRLRNREPEPGLLNLPIPLPNVPVLSPVLTPLVAGADPKPSPNPPAPKPNPPAAPPASSPAPPPRPSPRPSPAPAPPAPAPNPPNSGGGSGNGGSSSEHSGNGGDHGSPQGGNLGNHGDDDTHGSSGSSSQQNSGSNSSPSGSTPSMPAAGVPPEVDGPISIIGSSTFVVTPSGLVPKPVNHAAAVNAAADPSSSDSTSNDPARQSSPAGNSPSATQLGVPVTSGASHTTGGGSNSIVSGVPGGTDNGDGSSSNTTGSAAGSHSHVSGGAIGGIVAGILIFCIGIAFVILRNRHKRRKDERRVEWINGYVSGDAGSSAPDMLQRSNSKRSSWGTPVEYRISDAFRRSVASSDEQDYNYVVSPPSPYYDYERSASGAPVLPMPVHSPQMRAHSPEDPFADGLAQPLRRMSSLPLRISILSSASGHDDPFDDRNAPRAVTQDPAPPSSAASTATFGPGTRNIAFPLPPPTPGSTLQTPGIMISFPDSPISPTFAASGTSSYPRRAKVQETFTPAETRRDEVRVQRGDSVSIVSVYEDGWAFVQRESDNERGLMPLTHLSM